MRALTALALSTSLVLGPAAAQAAIAFSDLGTPSSATTNLRTPTVLSSVGGTATYLIGFVNDGQVGWNFTSGQDGDNNVLALTNAQARIRLSSLSGPGSIRITPSVAGTNAGTSFIAEAVGAVNSLSLIHI